MGQKHQFYMHRGLLEIELRRYARSISEWLVLVAIVVLVSLRSLLRLYATRFLNHFRLWKGLDAFGSTRRA